MTDCLLRRFGEVVEAIALKKIEIKRLKREAESLRRALLVEMDSGRSRLEGGDVASVGQRVSVETPSAAAPAMQSRAEWEEFMRSRIEQRKKRCQESG